MITETKPPSKTSGFAKGPGISISPNFEMDIQDWMRARTDRIIVTIHSVAVMVAILSL